VSILSPTTADNCLVASVGNDHPSTSYFVGTTSVTWTARDSSGNTATCVQTVTVVSTLCLQRIVPSFGPVAGGTPVRIEGFGFTDVIGVEFGDAGSATNVVVIGDSLITCDTPAGTATDGLVVEVTVVLRVRRSETNAEAQRNDFAHTLMKRDLFYTFLDSQGQE
jgi:hypothetical protein